MKNSNSLVNWLTVLTVGLFLLFLTLKTYDVIAWSWWLVFLPILIPFVISGVIVIAVLIYIKNHKPK